METQTTQAADEPLDKKIQPFISEYAHELLRIETARRNTNFGEVLNDLIIRSLGKGGDA